eukprot:m.255719 g.255719  ORF g.255719 m.255719 type:complete len:111 (+) comp19165_c0_seq3:186-518(+)
MSRQREKRAGKTIPNVGGMHRSKHRLEIQDVFCKNVCLTNLQLRDFPHQLFEKHKHKKHRPFDFATINTIKLSSNKISRIPAQVRDGGAQKPTVGGVKANGGGSESTVVS